MSKTIKELADELGVSKTAIRKYMTLDFRKKYTETTGNGVIVVSHDGEEILKSQCNGSRKQQETTANSFPETSETQVSAEIVAVLIKQLRTKDEQITALTEQIAAQQQQIAQLTAALENTTASLQAAQALHAGTIKHQQLLEDGEAAKKRKWWQFGKRTEG